MKEYHKINTCFKRESEKPCRIIEGAWVNDEIEYLKDNEWVFTEKVDGTNIRVMWDGAAIRFGGKTDDAQISVHLIHRLEDMFNSPEKFSEKFSDKDGVKQDRVCLYGEGYGAKIQKGGGNYLPDRCDFVLFDVQIGDWWLKREAVLDIAEYFDLQAVPIITTGTLMDMVKITRAGFNSQWGNFTAEGIVARPKVEMRDRAGRRIITKIKHKDFRA